ncbi:DUF441 domain-containing protein [Metabacillus malikii]|uniref:UPF0756 membrane protein J2S19_002278 n=1 Tax=Metabacillus malikii TaxID=1504265 RepID=A0ABT9ZFH6_9BACI|nr:DUF441 domain-containing protein [Metabacillus malikii]MDQ0231017.1 uncharacterized membrane protein (DUF441 family) [Metabacillus malikii]
MFNQPMLFLFILLIIGFIAKNQSLMIAAFSLMVIKIIGLESKVLPTVGAKGINWGVTVITIAVLVPIATGDIGFKQLLDAMKSFYAWIALGAGIAVALIAKNGLVLLAEDPHITTALVFGTILAVALFNGVAVGPLIGAGIAYLAMQMVKIFQ